MYFNVNLKLLTKLINSAFFWCVNCVDFKMHGETIKIGRKNEREEWEEE